MREASATFSPAPASVRASEALNPGNLVCRAVRAIKAKVPDIGIICDVALDPYTSHGHDGLLIDGEIDNDRTVEVLIAQAIVQTEAGCDILAPSDMMDGRIGAIRAALEEAGFTNTQLLAYAAKYSSAFYGPFRDAVGSGARLRGDKLTFRLPGRKGEFSGTVKETTSRSSSVSNANCRHSRPASVANPWLQLVRSRRQPISMQGVKGASKEGARNPTKPMNAPPAHRSTAQSPQPRRAISASAAAAKRSLSARSRHPAMNSITSGSALSRAKGSRSLTRHCRSRRRGVDRWLTG